MKAADFGIDSSRLVGALMSTWLVLIVGLGAELFETADRGGFQFRCGQLMITADCFDPTGLQLG